MSTRKQREREKVDEGYRRAAILGHKGMKGIHFILLKSVIGSEKRE